VDVDAVASHMLEAVIVTAAVGAGGGEKVRFLVCLHVGHVGGRGGWGFIHLLVLCDRLRETGWVITGSTPGP